MKIHCILHADFEQPGYFESWATERNCLLKKSSPYKGEPLPSVDEFDFLLIMGGPQSPLEINDFPYLKDEIELIKKAIKQKKSVVGVCLGAQLIAESYGVKTERSPNKEIGFFTLQLTDEGKQDPIFKNFPETFMSGHWHNDMPGLPSGSTVIAKSHGCPRQIVKFDDKVFGFQCHLEFDSYCIDALLSNCADDLSANTYVQSAEEISAQDCSETNKYLKLFLESFL